MLLQVMYQQIPQGSRGYELGYAEQFKYNISSSDSDLAKVMSKLVIAVFLTIQ